MYFVLANVLKLGVSRLGTKWLCLRWNKQARNDTREEGLWNPEFEQQIDQSLQNAIKSTMTSNLAQWKE